MKWARRAAVAMTALWVACGDLDAATGPQDPVFVLTGRLEGGELPIAAGTYRASTQWLTLGGGPRVSCLESQPAPECAQLEVDYQTWLQEHRLQPTVGGFEITLPSFPARSELLEYSGARLAFASAVVYDDRNNDRLLSATDKVLARSVFSGRISVLVFREGPLHPFYQELVHRFACPEPPVGYSVLRIDRGLSCRVTSITALLVEVAESAVQNVLCGAPVAGLRDPPDERPVARPRPPQLVSCLPGNRARVYVDTGGMCDALNGVRVMALSGCSAEAPNQCWNLADGPPDWWPCVVEPLSSDAG